MLHAPVVLAAALAVAAQPHPGLERYLRMLAPDFAFPAAAAVAAAAWLPDGRGLLEVDPHTADATGFHAVDPATGARTPLFDAATWARIVAEHRRLCACDATPDYTALDFARDGRSIHFRSEAAHFLFDRAGGLMQRLHVPDTRDEPVAIGPRGVFSPDYRRYAFVRNHDNLYIADTVTGAETLVSAGTSQDNVAGLVGVGDWFAWSPDGRRLAWVAADPSALSTYPLVHDLARGGAVEMLRYPFATDPDPALELWVVDVVSGDRARLAAGTPEMPYIRGLHWLPDGSALAFERVHRWQNRLELLAADPATRTLRTLLVDEDAAYLDPPHNLRFIDGGRRFLWSSRRTGWHHLYVHDTAGSGERQLTRGAGWETGEVVGYDEAGGWVYVYAYEDLGTVRRLIRVHVDGGEPVPVTRENGVHTVSMDPAARYVLGVASALDRPPVLAVHTAAGERLRTIAAFDVAPVDALGLRPPELVHVQAADGETSVTGLVWKPADFDPARRYPLVLQVYGGPHAKAAWNAWATADARARLAQLGFIVAEFDGRGTPHRGSAFQTGNYMALGTVDLDDQAAAVRQLVERPYVDGGRVGVTGVSHGGYMTLMLMLRYPDLFHVGVAAAPLTDPRRGPRQYIGRIMRTPDANPDGYDRASVLPHAASLRGRLLLAHGTHDRNVVFGHALQLAQALIDAGRPFDMLAYPEGAHVFDGRHARHFVVQQMSYFLEHLRPDGWAAAVAALRELR